MKAAPKKPAPPKPGKEGKEAMPAIMIMIGMKSHGAGDVDDKLGMGKDKPKPSMRGKVPGFGGKTRRTYVGS